MTATEAKSKKPGPALWLSILIFVIGAALASFGGIRAFTTAFESITVDAFDIPGSQTRTLDAGEFEVFGESGTILDLDRGTTFGIDDITVTQVATGNNIPLFQPALATEFNRNATFFTTVAVFEVTEPGDYRIDIESNGQALGLVVRALLSSFDAVRTPLILLIAGAIIAVLGMIMIVVGIVRRSRADKAARNGASPSPQFNAIPNQNFAAPQNPAAPQSSPPAPPGTQPPAPPAQDGHSASDANTPW